MPHFSLIKINVDPGIGKIGVRAGITFPNILSILAAHERVGACCFGSLQQNGFCIGFIGAPGNAEHFFGFHNLDRHSVFPLAIMDHFAGRIFADAKTFRLPLDKVAFINPPIRVF